MSFIGQSMPRKEGTSKVTGKAIYVDDLTSQDFVHAQTIRSTIAKGTIEEIVFSNDIDWSDFYIVSAKDIPGVNYVTLILNDQPVLADKKVNHPDEAILIIGHKDKEQLLVGAKNIHIKYKEEPSIHSIDESFAKSQVVWHDDNIQKHITIQKGNCEEGLKQAAVIVEGTYETGAQEQLYIETNGMIAEYDDENGVTVKGSLQCPYYVHKALKPIFDLPAEKVRVIQMETGGGFGGKEEYPSMIAAHAALMAYKCRKPVKLIYDRREDLAATTKRHPSKTHIKTGLTADGKLLSTDIKFFLDGGAYATLSAVVLSRGAIHAAGPYECPNVSIDAKAVATNCPPNGAYRGFGAPQSIFAFERHLDRCAKKIGISPAEIRRRNFLTRGKTTATSQEIRDQADIAKILEHALKISDYENKIADYQQWNRNHTTKKRGIGLATFFHGAGFTGSGEKMLESVAGISADKNGNISVLAGSTEIGQGKNTVFAQIAADALKIPYEDVSVAQPDTKFVPDSGPTVASRTVMVVGKLVERASQKLVETLQNEAGLPQQYNREQFKAACAEYLNNHDDLKEYAQYIHPKNINWDDQTYKGDAYATYAWATYIADLEIDLITCEVKIHDFYAVQDIGKVVNPRLAAGQIEGGVAQAIGYAIYEKVRWNKGHMENNNMTNYIMPTSVDLPRIHAEFIEAASDHGPKGAKGIGELPMDGTAPAIINAINFALGSDIDIIPTLPEDIMQVAKEFNSDQIEALWK